MLESKRLDNFLDNFQIFQVDYKLIRQKNARIQRVASKRIKNLLIIADQY